MSKVTFPCVNCGKLTAVRLEFLGKSVRCPHCQQVITAPLTAPASEPADPAIAAPEKPADSPPPELVVSVPPPVAEGSIFDAEEGDVGDALFDGPPQSLVEMPAEPPVPVLHIEAAPDPNPLVPNLQLEAASLLESPGGPGEGGFPGTVAFVTEEMPSSGTGLNFTAAPQSPAAPAPAGFTPEMHRAEETGGAEVTFPKTATLRAARGGRFIPTLLIFLIPYSIFSTVAVVILLLKKPQPSLELLPDDYPDAKAGGPRRAQERKRVGIDNKVPPGLVGGLGQTIQVGDLEVVPLKVERVGPSQLRLVLRLKDISPDVAFNPVSDQFLEPLFAGGKEYQPYTFLEKVGTPVRLYGGTWQTLPRDRLGPGEELTAELTTNPDFANVTNLKDFAGKLLWRVQVRRGFVKYHDRDYSTTAVVGVEFKVADIREAG